jgi:hypothetical protein
MLESVEWGEYKLDDLFEISSSKKIYHANQINKIYDGQINGSFPYVVRTTQRNGVRGYIIEDKSCLNDKNTLSFAQDTFSVFYQKERYFTGNKVKVLKAKFKSNNEKVMQYLTVSFQKSLSKSTWGLGSTVKTIKETKIQLPINNGEIDFNFMEIFISELETMKITELETYLEVSGLKDYTLTAEEQKALDDFEKGKFKFDEFDVIDVFDVKNSGNILSRDIVENSGDTPYLCASRDNNSVSSYISYDKKYIDKGNCVFIGGKTFVVTYQEKDFYSNDSHNLNLYLKNKDEKSKLKQLFLAACINKSLGYKYSWGDSISNRKIQKDKVLLPAKNKKINYEIMETLISAIQKQVIKDVVLYTNNKLAKSK